MRWYLLSHLSRRSRTFNLRQHWMVIMIEHTHDKQFYASQYGKFVVFLERPKLTRQKKYRQPIITETKWFKTTKLARIAKDNWEGKLC